MSKMLWVARDMDGSVWTYDTQPFWVGPDHWQSSEFGAEWDSLAFPDLQPGECRMFVEFAPRVAGRTSDEWVLMWDGYGRWVPGREHCAVTGNIILPMPPDPTPYLTDADPKAARRAEIDAQIAALQAERDELGA